MGRVPVCLAGLAGVMLMFPLAMPGSGRGWGFFMLAVSAQVPVGVGAVWSYRSLRAVSWVSGLAAVSLANAVVLGAAGLGSEPWVWGWAVARPELVRLVTLEMPGMLLLIWLVRAVEPGKLAARFFLAPALAAVLGYMGMGTGLDWRTGAGLLLAAGGAWRLWSLTEGDEARGLFSRDRDLREG